MNVCMDLSIHTYRVREREREGGEEPVYRRVDTDTDADTDIDRYTHKKKYRACPFPGMFVRRVSTRGVWDGSAGTFALAPH